MHVLFIEKKVLKVLHLKKRALLLHPLLEINVLTTSGNKNKI